jgi:hypothetical protein
MSIKLKSSRPGLRVHTPQLNPLFKLKFLRRKTARAATKPTAYCGAGVCHVLLLRWIGSVWRCSANAGHAVADELAPPPHVLRGCEARLLHPSRKSCWDFPHSFTWSFVCHLSGQPRLPARTRSCRRAKSIKVTIRAAQCHKSSALGCRVYAGCFLLLRTGALCRYCRPRRAGTSIHRAGATRLPLLCHLVFRKPRAKAPREQLNVLQAV